MRLSRHKISAITHLSHIGLLTPRNCGQFVFKWLETNGVGTPFQFLANGGVIDALVPNEKSTCIMNKLYDARAFDMSTRRWAGYRYRDYPSMFIED